MSWVELKTTKDWLIFWQLWTFIEVNKCGLVDFNFEDLMETYLKKLIQGLIINLLACK